MRFLRPVLLSLALAACAESKKQVNLSEAIPNLPLPPGGAFISQEGGEEALKLHFRSPVGPDSVAAYYRAVLARPPWHLVRDASAADGTITLYAEQSGPPLWVIIRKSEGSTGSYVDIAGAKTE